MKKSFNPRFFTGLFGLVMTLTMSAQQPNPETTRPWVRARIFPSIVSIKPGGEQQFQIVMANTRLKEAYNPAQVEWSVNKIVGGNQKIGIITSTGLYKAPAGTRNAAEIYVTGKVKVADNPVNTATVFLNGQSPQFKTSFEFGEPVNELKHFKNPVAIAVEKNGNFLVADDKILRFSASGKFINSFGEQDGDILGHLDGLLNIAVDNTGKIFASDRKIRPPRIMAFTPQGKHLYSFGLKGYHPGMTFNTRGIDFDSKNRMYLGDIDLLRVNVYDNSGKFQFHFGKQGSGTGEFNGYYDLALDNNNDVFVANYFTPCQKFDAAGHYLFSFATPDPPQGIIYTTDIATDSWGNVYVVVHGEKTENGDFGLVKDKDGNPVNIVKYNNNGDFISNIQLSDAGRTPVRLAVDFRDRLVVLFKSDKKIGVEVLEKVTRSN